MAVSNLKLGAFNVFLLFVWEIHFFYSVKEDLYTRPRLKRSTNNCSRILKVIVEQILVGYKWTFYYLIHSAKAKLI